MCDDDVGHADGMPRIYWVYYGSIAGAGTSVVDVSALCDELLNAIAVCGELALLSRTIGLHLHFGAAVTVGERSLAGETIRQDPQRVAWNDVVAMATPWGEDVARLLCEQFTDAGACVIDVEGRSVMIGEGYGAIEYRHGVALIYGPERRGGASILNAAFEAVCGAPSMRNGGSISIYNCDRDEGVRRK